MRRTCLAIGALPCAGGCRRRPWTSTVPWGGTCRRRERIGIGSARGFRRCCRRCCCCCCWMRFSGGCSWVGLLVCVRIGVRIGFVACIATDGVVFEAFGVGDPIDGLCDLVVWSDEDLLGDPGCMEDVDDLSRQCPGDIPCGSVEQDGPVTADLAPCLQEECLLERIGHAVEGAQRAWRTEPSLPWGGLECIVFGVVVLVDPRT